MLETATLILGLIVIELLWRMGDMKMAKAKYKRKKKKK